MKIKDRVYNIYLGLKKSTKRFPITIGFSIILAALLIYHNEVRMDLSKETMDRLIKLQLIMGMGILLSLIIDLLKERFWRDAKTGILISHISGIVFLVIYYNFLLKDLEFLSITRLAGIMIFLFIAFFYIPRLNRKKDDYEYYVMDIFSDIALTAVYSLVLLFGIFAILLTITALFDVTISGKIYYYTFLFIFFIFAIPFFLSKIPQSEKEFSEYYYSKSLKVLLSYIVIPLISIYTIILYIYFIKILVTWQWPKGLVSHLVLWYSSISVGIIFLINKMEEEDRVANLFRRIFPKIILPILLMMFISIGQRVAQYGITENRYYILALGIWVLAMMLYFTIKKSINTIIIPITLSLVVLNSVLGPFSSFSISKFSQNRRLNNILKSNNMLENNNIVKDSDLSKENQKEINNIIYYFNTYHKLKDIKVLDNEFTTDDMEETFGFAYEKYLPSHMGEEYFYLHTNLNTESIFIKDYDYYLNILPWNNNKFIVDNMEINYNDKRQILTIRENENLLIEVDLTKIMIEKYNSLYKEAEESRDEQSADEMTYETENDLIKLKIVFTNISGNISSGNIEVRNPEFLLFIKIK